MIKVNPTAAPEELKSAKTHKVFVRKSPSQSQLTVQQIEQLSRLLETKEIKNMLDVSDKVEQTDVQALTYANRLIVKDEVVKYIDETIAGP